MTHKSKPKIQPRKEGKKKKKKRKKWKVNASQRMRTPPYFAFFLSSFPLLANANPSECLIIQNLSTCSAVRPGIRPAIKSHLVDTHPCSKLWNIFSLHEPVTEITLQVYNSIDMVNGTTFHWHSKGLPVTIWWWREWGSNDEGSLRARMMVKNSKECSSTSPEPLDQRATRYGLHADPTAPRVHGRLTNWTVGKSLRSFHTKEQQHLKQAAVCSTSKNRDKKNVADLHFQVSFQWQE